jgi:hypothetical protein
VEFVGVSVGKQVEDRGSGASENIGEIQNAGIKTNSFEGHRRGNHGSDDSVAGVSTGRKIAPSVL